VGPLQCLLEAQISKNEYFTNSPHFTHNLTEINYSTFSKHMREYLLAFPEESSKMYIVRKIHAIFGIEEDAEYGTEQEEENQHRNSYRYYTIRKACSGGERMPEEKGYLFFVGDAVAVRHAPSVFQPAEELLRVLVLLDEFKLVLFIYTLNNVSAVGPTVVAWSGGGGGRGRGSGRRGGA
jgi:hypothetical protein